MKTNPEILVEEFIVEYSNPVTNACISTFGDIYLDNSLSYRPSLKDAYKAYDIINHFGFDDELSKVKIALGKANKYKGLNGGYAYTIYDTVPPRLMKTPRIVLAVPKKTNLTNIFDVLCHEMVHVWDHHYGELKKHELEVLKTRENGEQFVGDYDVHGQVFSSKLSTLVLLGFTASRNASYKKRYIITEKMNMNESMNMTASDIFNEADSDFMIEMQSRDYDNIVREAEIEVEDVPDTVVEKVNVDKQAFFEKFAKAMKDSIVSDTPCFFEAKDGKFFGVIT